MQVLAFTDLKAYLAEVEPFLLTEEARNCHALGLFGLLAQDSQLEAEAKYWAFYEDSGLTGAAWRYPSGLIGMTDLCAEAIESLIEEILNRQIQITAMFGAAHTADTFRDVWQRRASVTVTATIHQRIYQIDSVIYPASVVGGMFLPRPDDLELIADWNLKFSEDCGMTSSTKEARENAKSALKTNSRYFWKTDRGIVAMAGWSGKTRSGVRINSVYTPPPYRGQGYASALVAALSGKLLGEDGRKYCFLYTDLSNPISNKIYQKIGYKEVCDVNHFRFSSIS